MNNYVVYHLHSDLSNGITNIDSVTKYYEYIDYAKSLGMSAMAFSEHGSILEWVHKKTKIESAGMKYIHAEEFYLTENKDEKIRDNYHCVLIAKNFEGVKELNRLSSISFLRDGHFYYNPRITFDELMNTSDNIIVTSACLGSALFKGDDETKAKFLRFFIKNKHRCYLEIQHHNDSLQSAYNKSLYEISQRYDIPLIAGTDTHVLNERHLLGRSIMQKSKGVRFAEEDTWDLTFKTYDELVAAYRLQNSLPEEVYLQVIENTNKMAESIEEFKLDYSKKYPQFYDNPLTVLKQKICDGIKKRGVDKYPNFDEYKKKIAYELKTYLHNEAVNFILLEEDYKTALKNQGVNYGYSRGSVSGSVIAYLLGITEVDSIKYNLNFARFMNPERVSLADVDTDWFKEDRWRVRDYLFKKEGLHCCNIITFNTIKMKGAIKDVGRALGMSPELTQAISDLVQEDENKKEFVDERVKKQYKELFEYVDIVINTITSLGRHAAGLVVSPTDVDTDFGTLYISSDDKPISQINMKEIDSLNYVKLDVLGLDCVGLIDKTCKSAGIPFLTPDNMDFNDSAVWDDISKDTTLIFQFESDFAGDYLKEILKPQTIANIKKKNPNFSYIDLMSMANGAIRPAGASYRNELSQGIYRDNGNDALNEFLSPTLGFLVYQEQIIEFLHKFCGFTMGEADIIRRHFAKKTGTEDDIPIIKDGGYMNNSEHYIKGFIQTMYDEYGVEKENAEEIIVNFLQVIEDASSYLFSLNHAQPYSFLGFACGYLRHYYPLETLTSALNIYVSDKEKSANIKEYIKSKGYTIEPIKFGKSGSEYKYDKENKAIYQGIGAIKYCNSKIAEELLVLSENHYDDFIDLISDIKSKTSLDTRQLNILTGLNFFRDFGENKYLLNIIKIYDKLSSVKQIKKSQIESLGISEYLVKKYSNDETPALYRKIDNLGLIKELVSTLKNKPMGIIEYVKFEKEYLEYVTYTNESVDEDYYIIIDFVQGKDVTKPRFTARQIKTGTEVKSRIKKSKVFKENPFGLFSVLKITEFDKEFKRKPVNGEWVVTDEIEDILNNYEVIK